MTALTVKQRAKVNAALCLIHDHGFDANGITEAARTIMATGHDARSAYEKALNSFIASNPQIGRVVQKITQLVEASSPGTVAQYDQALSHYIASGDDTALTALAPMIEQDSIALAIRNGDMTEADIEEGGAAMALGFDPGHSADAKQEAPQAAAPAIGLTEAPATVAHTRASQVGFTNGPGFVSAKGQAARQHYSGFAPDALPAGHGLTPAGAKEAARAAASRGSMIIIEAASSE